MAKIITFGEIMLRLFPKDVVEAKQWDKISALCREALSIIAEVK